MDDASFQRWSDRLTELRDRRQKFIEQQLSEKADSFGPDVFFDAAIGSIENIMEEWFNFEQKSWEEQPPADPAAAVEASISEMESTVDFEADALNRDRESITSRITWLPDQVAAAEPSFNTFLDEIRKRYQLKVRGLVPGVVDKKKKIKEMPVVQASASGRSSGSSGVGLFVMFLVGLLFGGAPSLYFRDAVKKADLRFQEDRSKFLADQRALADSMTILHDSFEQLATGKTKNIPELDKDIGRIRASIAEKRLRYENEYQRERERILKKVPAGDRQDKALIELDQLKESRMTVLKAGETMALDPLVKQRDLLKDLLK